jgi:hypothetical protein
MPEEPEVPTEHLHEAIREHAEKEGRTWILAVALSTAMLAVFAALTALLAGHHANEAMIEQIRAADQWAYYQAKGIKLAVLESKMELLETLGQAGHGTDGEKAEEYKVQQKEIQEKAEEKEKSSEHHLHHHNTLAKAVTLFQIAIAVAAISVLTRKKWMWFGSLMLGSAGLIIFVLGVI